MSHVNAEKIVSGQIKSVAGAGTAKMMGSTPRMGPMMMGGMGPMMSEGMGAMMKGSMGPMMREGMGPMTMGAAGSSAGRSVVRKVFTHPLVLFGLGIAVGCYVYKYRKSIISASDEAQ